MTGIYPPSGFAFSEVTNGYDMSGALAAGCDANYIKENGGSCANLDLDVIDGILSELGAVIKELGGTYDCTKLTNLADTIKGYVTAQSGGGIGPISAAGALGAVTAYNEASDILLTEQNLLDGEAAFRVVYNNQDPTSVAIPVDKGVDGKLYARYAKDSIDNGTVNSGPSGARQTISNIITDYTPGVFRPGNIVTVTLTNPSQTKSMIYDLIWEYRLLLTSQRTFLGGTRVQSWGYQDVGDGNLTLRLVHSVFLTNPPIDAAGTVGSVNNATSFNTVNVNLPSAIVPPGGSIDVRYQGQTIVDAENYAVAVNASPLDVIDGGMNIQFDYFGRTID